MKKYQIPTSEQVEMHAMKFCMASVPPAPTPSGEPPIEGDPSGNPTI